jgi:lysophospholipid acyltransferase (LPLAT)-like uncharacterized protein
VIRRLLKTNFVYCIVAFLAACYIRLVFITSRWDFRGSEIIESYSRAEKPFIACFWHGRLNMMVYAWIRKDLPFQMLLSAHRDGQLISRTISYFGISSIVGSTGRDGTQALRELIKILRGGNVVGMTPDGPRGPRQIVNPGIITLAKLAQVDIIPATFSTSRRYRLSTWDRFHLALPFSRGIFLYGDPISPPEGNDPVEREEVRQRLERAMTELQNRADEAVGVDSLHNS